MTQILKSVLANDELQGDQQELTICEICAICGWLFLRLASAQTRL